MLEYGVFEPQRTDSFCTCMHYCVVWQSQTVLKLVGSYLSEIMYSTLSTFKYKQDKFLENGLYKTVKINKKQFSRST